MTSLYFIWRFFQLRIFFDDENDAQKVAAFLQMARAISFPISAAGLCQFPPAFPPAVSGSSVTVYRVLAFFLSSE